MTVVKQVAVTSAAHVKNLGRYLDDERAIAREGQNLVREGNWQKEMDATREAYGHNSPARAGCANTYMYHQVLGFNPDECAMNGGKMTPQACMDYAREYVQERYPNQEAVWVLHEERCQADGTSRYAVHVGINRTDLETGRRLAEGRSKQAKISRANSVRDLDRKWGLREVRANQRNSRAHARQPTRAEKEMAARGVKPNKETMREAVKQCVAEVRQEVGGNPVRALAEKLDERGVRMKISKYGRDFQLERNGLKVNSSKLGRGFSQQGITAALGASSALERGAGLADEGMSR